MKLKLQGEGLREQRLGKVYLFLRKLGNLRILREAPEVMAASEDPEGMIVAKPLSYTPVYTCLLQAYFSDSTFYLMQVRLIS